MSAIQRNQVFMPSKPLLGIARAAYVVGIEHQSEVIGFLCKVGIMGWGCIRIGIFSIAFLAGFFVVGPSRTSAGGAAAVQSNGAKGTTIIVLHDHSPQVGRYVVRKIRERAFD